MVIYCLRGNGYRFQATSLFAKRKAQNLIPICRCGGTADALVSGSSEEIRVGSNPVTCTRKRLRIGYNSEFFSVKSACVGINPLRG